MKKLITACVLLAMGFMQNAQAITVGYSAHLVFIKWETAPDGSPRRVSTSSDPFGESDSACQANRQAVIELHEDMGFALDESRSTPCRPLDERLPEMPPKLVNLLPPAPVCLSCPLLNDFSIDLFFPDKGDLVRELYWQFKIKAYNAELNALQQRYDLEGFTAELHRLQDLED